MINKTKDYRLKANANYEAKVKHKVIILRSQDQALIESVDADPNPFNPLVRRLLSEHYGVENIEV